MGDAEDESVELLHGEAVPLGVPHALNEGVKVPLLEYELLAVPLKDALEDTVPVRVEELVMDGDDEYEGLPLCVAAPLRV